MLTLVLEILNHNGAFRRQFPWLITSAGPKLRETAAQGNRFGSFCTHDNQIMTPPPQYLIFNVFF